MDYSQMLLDALGMFVFLGVELSLLFILISAVVNLLQKYIPEEKIQRILSGQKGRGYIFAALLGAITPFCSCSTIPMLRGLLKAKAGFGPTLTFLFSSPLLNPIIIGLFVVTFGWKVTLIYSVISLAVSIIGGFVLDKAKFDRFVIPEGKGKSAASCCGSSKPAETSCCSTKPIQEQTTSCCAVKPTTSCCSAPAPKVQSGCGCSAKQSLFSPKFSNNVKVAFAEAWEQFKDVLPYLLLGISIGSFVYGFVPSEFIAKYASGDSPWAVPISAVIGIPLYVRAEALIPLSAVLVGKGMGLGAVMALIIGGAGASITEVILLKSMFRMPMIIAFLVVIIGMAISLGYLFQYMM